MLQKKQWAIKKATLNVLINHFFVDYLEEWISSAFFQDFVSVY